MGLADSVTVIFSKILGTGNDAMIRGYQPLVTRVGRLEKQMQERDDAELRELGTAFLRKVRDEGVSLASIQAEAFALVREVADRQLGMWKAIEAVHPDWNPEWWGQAALAVDEARAKLANNAARWTIDVPAAVYARIRERFPQSLPPFRMRAHDVQLIGAAVLHEGNIAEQKTGEGKTLAAVFSSYLNALSGEGVHIVTVNDYLARRDADENEAVHRFLGLSVGAIHPEMPADQRRAVYAMDITYGTTSEFGFDYLRDNLKQTLAEQVQTRRTYAIVDEVDSVLIDEARVPLIISGPAQGREEFYSQADAVARQLVRDEDFEVDIKDRNVTLSDEGIEKATELFGVRSMYSAEGMHLPHFLENALKAHHLFGKDKEYMVTGGQVCIVDEFTGRVLSGRRWSEGLHQAIEVKEGLQPQPETQTYATITLQNFFRLYTKLSGMTGTAMTEANEFNSIYKLQPVAIPTNRPVIRRDYPDLIYGTEAEKHEAIADEVKELHGLGQPVLVGTITVETSETLSELFTRRGIKHNVLNAKQHAREAQIVKDAGQVGAVTIATNMAGRGTDIKLGKTDFATILKHWQSQGMAPKKLKENDGQLDEAIIDFWSKKYLGDERAAAARGKPAGDILTEINKERASSGWPLLPMPSELKGGVDSRQLGGLRIIGSERHDSRRIDNQLRGRSGRQGDPGSSRFYLSLEDSLMKRFAGPRMAGIMRSMGLRDGVPIESKIVSNSVEKAQKRVEEYNFGIRKNLLEYDQVMNLQRKNVYRQRQALLEGRELPETFDQVFFSSMDDLVQSCAVDGTRGEALSARISERFAELTGLPPVDSGNIPAKEGGDACRDRLLEVVRAELGKRREEMQSLEAELTERGEIMPIDFDGLQRLVMLDAIDRRWKDHIDFMDHLRRGIGLESYGQKDPKMRFKEEGFKSFEAMKRLMHNDISRTFFRLQVQIGPAEGSRPGGVGRPPRAKMFEKGGFMPKAVQPAAAEAAHHGERISMQEPRQDDDCPCGSGMPYKRCHGKV